MPRQRQERWQRERKPAGADRRVGRGYGQRGVAVGGLRRGAFHCYRVILVLTLRSRRGNGVEEGRAWQPQVAVTVASEPARGGQGVAEMRGRQQGNEKETRRRLSRGLEVKSAGRAKCAKSGEEKTKSYAASKRELRFLKQHRRGSLTRDWTRPGGSAARAKGKWQQPRRSVQVCGHSRMNGSGEGGREKERDKPTANTLQGGDSETTSNVTRVTFQDNSGSGSEATMERKTSFCSLATMMMPETLDSGRDKEGLNQL